VNKYVLIHSPPHGSRPTDVESCRPGLLPKGVRRADVMSAGAPSAASRSEPHSLGDSEPQCLAGFGFGDDDCTKHGAEERKSRLLGLKLVIERFRPDRGAVGPEALGLHRGSGLVALRCAVGCGHWQSLQCPPGATLVEMALLDL